VQAIQTTFAGLLSAVQVAESGSFAGAAKALDLTAAAVSKNVAKLEAQLQVRLFNRTTRRLFLTEEGKVFLAQARAGLTLLEDATKQASEGLKPQGIVRINCPVGFGRSYIVPLMPEFQSLYPDVQLDLQLNDQAVDLVGGGFDVGIRGGSQPPEGMVGRKIADLSMILVASPKYLAARGTPQIIADLGDHDLLKVKFLNGRILPWLFEDASTSGGTQITFEGPAKLTISDPDIVIQAAILGMGIARTGSHHAYEAIRRGDLVEVLPTFRASGSVVMSLFYPHRTGLAPRVRVLVNYLLDRLTKEPSLRQGPMRSNA
jgi:DNA-binding transcriptional LysR family regulator